MNPVLWMELRVRIRERKLWVVSMLFLACMAVMSAFCVANVTRYMSATQVPADFGVMMIKAESGFLLVLILILAPLSGAGRISQEREQRTLAGLLNTPMSRWSIVWGKLLSVWIFVFWLWMLGLPFFTAAYIWGGTPTIDWLGTMGFILAAGMTVSSISLGLSGFFSRTLTSYLGTGIVLFFWMVAWPLIGTLAANLMHGTMKNQEILQTVFFYHHPLAILFMPNEPKVYMASIVVWSAFTFGSILLARAGLERGLAEKI